MNIHDLEIEWQTADDGFPAGVDFKTWLANQVVALRESAQGGQGTCTHCGKPWESWDEGPNKDVCAYCGERR